MKFLTLLLSIFAGLSVTAQINTESQIKSLSQKRIEWLLAGNIDSLSILYDPAGISIHSNGMVKFTPEHLTDVKNKRPSYKHIAVKETSVKEYGQTAVLVGKGLFQISMDGQDFSYQMVFTEVYVKQKDKWTLVARHASAIQ